MQIWLENPKRTLDTKDVPEEYDPLFCGWCGCRIGWWSNGITDKPLVRCDDCADTEEE